MMDDPAFREQMMSMVASGGAEQLDALHEAMAGDDRLGGAPAHNPHPAQPPAILSYPPIRYLPFQAR